MDLSELETALANNDPGAKEELSKQVFLAQPGNTHICEAENRRTDIGTVMPFCKHCDERMFYRIDYTPPDITDPRVFWPLVEEMGLSIECCHIDAGHIGGEETVEWLIDTIHVIGDGFLRVQHPDPGIAVGLAYLKIQEESK
jgi:hypothetical protein